MQLEEPEDVAAHPQPKQWKKPLSRLTWNDGVFSAWNGHSPCSWPRTLERHVLLDHLNDVRLGAQIVDERCGKQRHSAEAILQLRHRDPAPPVREAHFRT